MLDHARLLAAYHQVRDELLAERTPEGHWVGELSSSALSTATALSALALVARHGAIPPSPLGGEGRGEGAASNATPPLTLTLSPTGRGDRRIGESETWEHLKTTGLRWLVESQNADGGWGDTDKSRSNIATTMLVRAAIVLCGAASEHADALARAEAYIAASGGLDGLRRRYGRDKTFAVPILANCALAGLVPWSEVSTLPFEAACLPQSWYRFARLPVVSYAIPALVAIGQAKFVHDPPRNPVTRLVRRLSVGRSLRVLQRMQPTSGGYLEATPLTSFVVMSLAGSGRADHPVVRQSVKFLLDSARPDGSWPIDTNLATWVTTLAVNALGGQWGMQDGKLLEWLLSCQHHQRHAFTGADPGGWGWSDLSGAVPDADDTAGALMAIRHWPTDREKNTIASFHDADLNGTLWLKQLQNRDGGLPTFCRGWGKLPFDRSGCDLTAHTLRAFAAWSESCETDVFGEPIADVVRHPIERGLAYLAHTQRADGSWVPLWFGNQHAPDEENPIYGTARVLLAYRDLQLMDGEPAQRGLAYLVSRQNPDGGWGGGPVLEQGVPAGPNRSSVEETALTVEALLAADVSTSPANAPAASDSSLQNALSEGLRWLVEAVEGGQHRDGSPIGLYFAKLWYYERLYPLVFTVSALRHAVERAVPGSES